MGCDFNPLIYWVGIVVVALPLASYFWNFISLMHDGKILSGLQHCKD